MDYTQAAREVLGALRAASESDDTVWWHRALAAIEKLHPTSAIAYALHRPEVWRRDLRLQARTRPPAGGNAFVPDELIEAAEAAAAADGTQHVSEVHLARAMAQSESALYDLGVYSDVFIRTVVSRVGDVLVASAKLAHPMGAARRELLQTIVGGLTVDEVLSREERSGTVERKRSLDNGDAGTLARQVDAAVALVNGNREEPVFLIFGQEDNRTIVGEVNHHGEWLERDAVRRAQRRLDQQLQACDPPVIVKWQSVVREEKTVWLACMLGRERGTGVRTPRGAWPYRSGEDTHYATQAMVAAWHREAISGADLSEPPEPLAMSASPRRDALRAALGRLRQTVTAYFAAPPELPTSIPGGRKLADWQPVVEPILVHFSGSVEEIIALGVAANDDDLPRLGRGLRDVFAQREPRGGSSWVINAPRLVCRLIADQIMAVAYVSERWSRIPSVGNLRIDSHMGRVPWVVSPEYRHLESLGENASAASELSVKYARDHMTLYTAVAAGEEDVPGALHALGLGFALAKMAWDQRIGGESYPAFAVLGSLLGRELEIWEDERAIIGAFALLAGEDPDVFAARLAQRLAMIARASQTSGYFMGLVDRGFAAVARISDAALSADEHGANARGAH